MKNNKKLYAMLLVVLVFSLLVGCGSKETKLTSTDADTVLAFSEAKTDNLLVGMNANDYAAFSLDFDKDMSAAMPQAQFDTLKKDRDTKLGLYVSRQVNSVVKQGDFYAVIYDAKFEKDAAVTVRVVFRAAEPHAVSGLWFSK
ncbi:MAG: DUF3887 domain-containing protein [Chloroflexota bacterium]